MGKLQPYLGIFDLPYAFHLPQSIEWEPVASTNHTKNYLAGSETKYDYKGDGWED
jgi:hypothetical protein